ncbi:MAG: cellulose binding domain-containing protein, partial [Planctomycetota bacterium]|nr:cellulose binding domain-containing protein [Planctomycetota bacterium]
MTHTALIGWGRRKRRVGHIARVPHEVELLEDRALLTFSVDYDIPSEWSNGYEAAVTIHNEADQAVENWELEFDDPHSINSIWNASIAEHSGSHYKIVAPSWARDIPAHGSVSFGYLGSRNGPVSVPTNYKLNGEGPGTSLPTVSIQDTSVVEGDTASVVASFTVILSSAATGNVSVDFETSAGSAVAGADFLTAVGTVDFAVGEIERTINVTVLGDTFDEPDETFLVILSNVAGATIGDGQATGTIVDNDAAVVPEITINDADVTEGDALAGGFLATDGNQIVDAAGNPVRITGVSWFGLETHNFAPHGLWSRNWRDMMDQIKDTGFNTIRLPYSNELFDAASTPNSIDAALNP